MLARNRVDVRNAIILIALVILLAAGTAYSVYTFMGLSFGRPVGGFADRDRAVGTGPLVDVGTFTVNLVAGDKPSARFMRTGIVLEVDSEQTQRRVEERMAPVRDRIIDVLRQETMESIHGSEGLQRLKQKLRTAANEVMPEGAVVDVYFVDLVVQ